MSQLSDAFLRSWQTVECPLCGIENDAQLASVVRGDAILCRGCHAQIRLIDGDSSVSAAMNQADAAMKQLRSTVSRIRL